MERHELDQRVEDFLNREERERHAKDLDLPSEWDSALAVGEVVGNLHPIIGVAAALVRGVFPSRRSRRRLSFLPELSRAISRIEDHVDEARAWREGFVDVLEDAVDQVDRRAMEGKQAYYAAALANSLTADSPEGIDLEAMRAALVELRPAHLRLIALLQKTRVAQGETGLLPHKVTAVLLTTHCQPVTDPRNRSRSSANRRRALSG
jgi:hypothetical protein